MNVRGYSVLKKIGVCRKGFKVFKTTFFVGFRYQFEYKISNL